ncbi:alpha/beta hydrolase family protein [Cognatilysobacter terrigena]|uniref:alpha/beta hydrolase family protein n=1 Tax=Cognatilysobacter terrigena TaxID=2488749 RepID=UPI00105F3FBC|nr:S9 family peptidase [Lysobacter terrigena]
MRRNCLATALLLAGLAPLAATAQTAPRITLDQAMADPDWIGNAVEQAWWSWDGQNAYFTQKRAGATIRDTFRQPITGGAATKLDGADRAAIDGDDAVVDASGTRMAFSRGGDIFVRDLKSGALTQVTRTDAEESRPQWGPQGQLVFRAGNDWFTWRAGTGIAQASTLKLEDDPDKAKKDDDLRARQLRLIDTLRTDREKREAAKAQDKTWRAADPTAAPPAAYLGKDLELVDSALSPDGRWLLAVTYPKDANLGQQGKLPKYVTESGYEEFEEVRTRVGRNAPAAHSLWLVETATGIVTPLKFDDLPGIKTDPLAELRKKAGKKPLDGARDVRIETDGDGTGPAIHWSDDGRDAAVLVRAVDNKDRWIAQVDLGAKKLVTRDRLTDNAWINWNFNDFGWLPNANGRNRLWFLSEKSGYSHLYVSDAPGSSRALTSGKWEVSAPVATRDGRRFYFECNRKWPGDYEICAVDANGGDVREVTSLDGVEDFDLSPDESKLLVRHSSSYVPPQLAVVDANGGAARELTDTRSEKFKSIDFIAPEIVQIPSKHGAGTIWGKFYGPKNYEPGKTYPIVFFIHGAGYLQNVHARYPNYFREQMFNNLLVDSGYVVLDIDYRASSGYGRDWRTAIYRNMGHPELDDHLDALDWAVASRHADRDLAGLYGGSYGGFMTLMGLFRSPGTFKAGAALRPVTDWSQYNHEYTSNILNTPELDPDAYATSSPIEYAKNLQDNLLIAHGMIDDNVFFRDSVVLTQKLIELHKDKWTLAPYPLERHGFVHADSWYDEYRRIRELFAASLGK